VARFDPRIPPDDVIEVIRNDIDIKFVPNPTSTFTNPLWPSSFIVAGDEPHNQIHLSLGEDGRLASYSDQIAMLNNWESYAVSVSVPSPPRATQYHKSK
jgi:hypothetical protein